jgi:hypothetical protein
MNNRIVRRNIKTYKIIISHTLYLIFSVAVKITLFVLVVIQFLSGFSKVTLLWYNEIHSNTVVTTSVEKKPRLKR